MQAQNSRVTPDSNQQRQSDSATTKPKLLDQVRHAVRARHYSKRTEQTYVDWIKRFILFHARRHPSEMAESEINQLLTELAVNKKVSASTQNQALSAILFLYQHVLKKPLEWINPAVRAKKPKRLPVVLTREEVKSIIDVMEGAPKLVATLLYGSGLRLNECLQRVRSTAFRRKLVDGALRVNCYELPPEGGTTSIRFSGRKRDENADHTDPRASRWRRTSACSSAPKPPPILCTSDNSSSLMIIRVTLSSGDSLPVCTITSGDTGAS